MQSPTASFFAPALTPSVLPGQRTGSVLPGIAQNGFAGIAGTGSDNKSFFDLLMMAGIENDGSHVSIQNLDEADQSMPTTNSADPFLLTSSVIALATSEAQAGSAGQFQLIADLFSSSQTGLPLTGVNGQSDFINPGSSQPFLSGLRANTLLQSPAKQAGGSFDLMNNGTPVINPLKKNDTSFSIEQKSMPVGMRELSKHSFLSFEKVTTPEVRYTLNVDSTLAQSASTQAWNPDAPIAKQTEQLLGLNNASSVQLTHATEGANKTTSQLSSSETNSQAIAAVNQSDLISRSVVPVAQKAGSNKPGLQQDQRSGIGKSIGAEDSKEALVQVNDTSIKNTPADKRRNAFAPSSESINTKTSEDEIHLQLQDEMITLNNESGVTSNTLSQLSGQLQSELLVKDSDADAFTKVDQVRFVLPNLAHASSRNGTSIVIDLEPRSLGPAELRLTVRNEVVHAELRVNSHEAKQAVEANLEQLQKSFERAGITVSKVDVSLTNQGDASQFSQQQGWNRPQFKVHHQRFTLDESLDGVQSIDTQPKFSASTLIRPQPGRSWTA